MDIYVTPWTSDLTILSPVFPQWWDERNDTDIKGRAWGIVNIKWLCPWTPPFPGGVKRKMNFVWREWLWIMMCPWLLPSDCTVLLRLLTWLVFPWERQSLMPFPLLSLFSSRSTKDGLFLPTTGFEAYKARAELGSMSIGSELQKKPLYTCFLIFLLRFSVDSRSVSDRMQDQRERTTSLRHRRVQHI